MAARRRRKVTWPIVNKDDIRLRNVIEEYLQYHDGLTGELLYAESIVAGE